ncbi:hypothetical protein GM658_28510 [Pseudoduganella eburnea]|uniref:SMI1/KNR4 family protein n=1 Tax=Massilia eburnea TaxID=1776165 RepID=A0A6L6QSY1_9BURK|nr:SMI1/KNR4 family protein [Massilia eburnea]MTW14563.1 hypothetical protein [Massilia eburnea]
MSILNNLVKLLALGVKDAKAVSERDIRNFANEMNLHLREDHLEFLMNFGCETGSRLEIFKRYGGDFGFETFERVYRERRFEMEAPLGTTFFGTSFLGDSFCVDGKSGQIFVYDEGQRYGIVHEQIDGFLLECLLYVDREAFSDELIKRDLDPEFIEEFRLNNIREKLNGATRFELEYVNVDNPEVVSEYYMLGSKLIALYPSTRSLVTFSGGVLDQL